MGEQRNPGDSTSFLVPQVESPVGGWPSGSIVTGKQIGRAHV